MFHAYKFLNPYSEQFEYVVATVRLFEPSSAAAATSGDAEEAAPHNKNEALDEAVKSVVATNADVPPRVVSSSAPLELAPQHLQTTSTGADPHASHLLHAAATLDAPQPLPNAGVDLYEHQQLPPAQQWFAPAQVRLRVCCAFSLSHRHNFRSRRPPISASTRASKRSWTRGSTRTRSPPIRPASLHRSTTQRRLRPPPLRARGRAALRFPGSRRHGSRILLVDSNSRYFFLHLQSFFCETTNRIFPPRRVEAFVSYGF